ncbi:MAG: VOC family protein [Chloroflexi bacterium]|nr:VOC family protein [Chloroflexota bacterium]
MSSLAQHPPLPATTGIGPVALTVADLARSLSFYEDILGLRRWEERAGAVVLGSARAPLLEIVEHPGARPKPPGTTGLYHVALLLPSRRDLGRLLRHLLERGYPLAGAADHLVSEAVYLADPDRNGLELSCDRPPEQWPRVNGRLRMASDPLDLPGVLAAAEEAPWEGIAPETRVGHLHLQVGDLTLARRWYVDRIGFRITAELPGALFLAAGSYHHHLGLNTWTSEHGPPPPGDTAGLRWFTLQVPEATAREALARRLSEAGVALRWEGDAFWVQDPWGHQLVVRG